MNEAPQFAFSPLTTRYGSFDFYVFSWSPNEQDNVLALVNLKSSQQPVTVRVQSACYSGEIFESLDCDCHWQLETSLERVQRDGGVFIYMLADGRGAGLLAKVRGMHLSATRGLDTAEAYDQLGVPRDPRDYSRAAHILRHFGISDVRLLTNNPRKLDGLREHGFSVTREPLESVPTEHNRAYLHSKSVRLGHLLQAFNQDEADSDS